MAEAWQARCWGLIEVKSEVGGWGTSEDVIFRGGGVLPSPKNIMTSAPPTGEHILTLKKRNKIARVRSEDEGGFTGGYVAASSRHIMFETHIVHRSMTDAP